MTHLVICSLDDRSTEKHGSFVCSRRTKQRLGGIHFSVRLLPVLAALVVILSTVAMPQSHVQDTGVDVQLRGISAVSGRVAWASGAQGTVLRTVDGGQHWEKLIVPGAVGLDFRDIQAFDESTAFVLSAGPGDQSRIYKTIDGGRHWRLQFTNREARAFYDCFAFWDRTHGIALSDSVDGKFPLLVTSNGKTWSPLKSARLPDAFPNEGAFAASGACLITLGKNDVWFTTGGPAARVFHSGDRGRNWTAVATPIRSGAPSQGIFSVAFWTVKDGVIVGGDYKDPGSAENTAAFTSDGGLTWSLAARPPAGYRSAVAVRSGTAQPALVAVGTNGSDCSLDAGHTWLPLSLEDYNAVSFAGSTGWAVGSKGKVIRIDKLPFAPSVSR
jgi:photosystem II stability/assembly factor-like uncharacterized protein